LLLKAVLTATAATAPVQPLPSLTLARLYVQQQALDEAVVVLERLLEREPANVEAQDLLALIRDMMAPLPEAPPPLPRGSGDRRVAALARVPYTWAGKSRTMTFENALADIPALRRSLFDGDCRSRRDSCDELGRAARGC